MSMTKTDKIYVAGHEGMVGSAFMRELDDRGYENVITAERQGIDLRDSDSVQKYFKKEKPDYVFLAAAKVGGIKANSLYPAEFAYDNLMIQNNVIHSSWQCGVKKLVFMGSSCVYPKECSQPMKEEYLLTGILEPTNEAYAIAKIAGIKMIQYYEKQYGFSCICPMPCNLYGPNDSYDLENSHVLSALVKKFTDAVDDNREQVVLWGTGRARREFLHVDDLAKATMLLVDKWNSSEIINVGSGEVISIKNLAALIASKIGYNGEIGWDSTMPDGMLEKYLDVSKIRALGFKPEISLVTGIEKVIKEYRSLKHQKN